MIVLAWTLLVIASYFAAGNLFVLVCGWLDQIRGIARTRSFVPLLSLIFSFLAWLAGNDRFGMWAFLPALIDPAVWWLLPLAFVQALRHDGKRSADNGPPAE